MSFEVALQNFRTFSFSEFSVWAMGVSSITSEVVCSVLASLSLTQVKETELNLRLIISLHFMLGKQATFSLNAAAVSKLLQLINRSKDNFEIYGRAGALSAQLLALWRGSATIGIENQLCILFCSSTPEMQTLLLPLVHRAFYVRGRESLSAGTFEALIASQVSGIEFSHQIRCVSLVHSTRSIAEELFVTQLLNGDVIGVKPLFGSAPHATGLDGKKLTYLTVLFSCDNPSKSQIHHCYLLSAINSYIDTSMASNSSKPHHTPLTADMCTILVTYITRVFQQLTYFVTPGKIQNKIQVYSSKGVVGLKFIEAVASEALMLTKRLYKMHPNQTSSLLGEATSFLYAALDLSTTPHAKVCNSELPEFASPAAVWQLGPLRSGPPVFTSHIILRCLEFQIEVAPVTEVQNFFSDIFVEPMWSRLVEEDCGGFPLQFCLVLLRNAKKLKKIMHTLSPRVFWLLSQRPHTLFPVVKRLIRYLFTDSTSLDIFYRIIFLPLLCFSSKCSPNPAENDSFLTDLWCSMLDFEVDDKRKCTSFSLFCLKNRYNFEDWDQLHQDVTCFDPNMMASFRLIRPLLSEYFKCAPLPLDILTAISMSYFFMVAPVKCRHTVAEYLHESGRWVLETCPELILASSDMFINIMVQEFLPSELRCRAMQRWAAMMSASALSAISHLDATSKEAVRVFEVVHDMVWEMTAKASAEVTGKQSPTRTVGNLKAEKHISRSKNVIRSAFCSAFESPYETQVGEGCVSPSLLLRQAPLDWKPGQGAWIIPVNEKGLFSLSFDFFEHMHSLIISLALLTRICPTVKERGIICLAHIVKTLSRSTNRRQKNLVVTAVLCMKYLRFPIMNGVGSMPLFALLGLKAQRI